MIPSQPGRPIDLARSRVMAVVNRAGGGVDGRSEALVRRLLDAGGAASAAVVSAGPDDLHDKLGQAVERADVVVVLGGDGTIAAAANLCAGGGPAVVPLPGGTMNVFSRALYGPRPWPQVLREVLSAPASRAVSGGRAGERLFLVSAILGAPPRWVQVREALRRGRLLTGGRLFVEVLQRPLSGDLLYRFDPQTEGVARAIAVRCPLASAALSPDADALEAAAIDPRSAARALELGVNAMFGRWRSDPSIRVRRTRTVRVHRSGGVPGVLDGEAVDFPDDVEIAFVPHAMTVLVGRG